MSGPYRELAVVQDEREPVRVVCKDCRYFDGYISDWERSDGEHQTKRVAMCRAGHVDKATGLPKPTFTQCGKRNADNLCPYYKRIWWKFWAPR